MKTCLYPGSFDPFTNGHLDILLRGSKLFDQVVVGVLQNSAKQCQFSAKERVAFIQAAAQQAGVHNVKVVCFEGLTVELARAHHATVILRGLRNQADFAYESTVAQANRQLAPHIETLLLLTDAKYAYLSSGLVKEVAHYGGDISAMVPNTFLDANAGRT